MMSILLRAILIAVATLPGGLAASAGPADALSCEKREVAGASYVTCAVDPKAGRLRLFWKDADGQPYRTFAAVAKAVEAEGKSLAFAMNAGMYTDDFTPLGLHVEGGQELRPANRAEIKASGVVPNFYKKPNGIFFIDKNGPAILPTAAFLKRRTQASLATQSGPMLVIDGKLNSIFIVGSTDRTRRSGVGICKGGTVRFAISDDPVNFHDFAQFFRDELKCAEALFLDGGRGAGVYVPAMGRDDWSGHGGYGPIVGLIE